MTPIPRLERFLYSHHLYGGARQAFGVILPPLVVGGLMSEYQAGMTAAVGAACVAFLDQPGGPRRYGIQGMAAAVLMGSMTVAIVGLASANTIALWLVVPVLCFLFSMFTVFGKQGGLLGFACLLIMTLTMRARPDLSQLWIHVGYSLGGGLFYFAYSYTVHRLSWLKEEQQALSAALFATADYMKARSMLYDTEADLDEHYRKLVRAQHHMTDEQQAARDTVLRELPQGNQPSDRARVAALNLFIDMVALLDTLVATHTDYSTLRRHFKDADTLLFPRDALRKLAANVEQVAVNVARNRRRRLPHSITPELRALEFDLRELKEQGFADATPEVYALLLQVMRRLRRANTLVQRMSENTRQAETLTLVDQRLDQALDRFLSRRKWRIGMLTSNLRLDSPHFRYAVRVTVAAMAAMTISTVASNWITLHLVPGWVVHDYWVLLTILVIMKPGYALTRQRNGWRLTGTLLGCAIALLIFDRFESMYALLALLVLTGVLWYALLQLHFMLAATANTVFVLLAFHFMSPQDSFVIGERVVDTLLASAIALLCSLYVLPWWESNYMGSLAAALRRANLRFLRSGLRFVELSTLARAHTVQGGDTTDTGSSSMLRAQHDAEVQWRVHRKNVHIAFSNFTAAFYRMMAEPASRHQHVEALNALMIQHHTLASHVSNAIPLLTELDVVPPTVLGILNDIEARLAGAANCEYHDNAPRATMGSGTTMPIEAPAVLVSPLRQMLAAATVIEQLTPLVLKPQARAVPA